MKKTTIRTKNRRTDCTCTTISELKDFRGIEEDVNENRDCYYEYMLRHFPNPTQNPHQVFLDYLDIDEIDG